FVFYYVFFYIIILFFNYYNKFCDNYIFLSHVGLLMVRSRPNEPRSGLWTESVRSQVSKTMWTVWTVEFFYHKSICFLLKILFYYHNSIQIINKNAKFIHCLYEFLFFLKSNFLNK